MKILVLLSLLIVYVSCDDKMEFQNFIQQFGKTYKDDVERAVRFNIFKDNLNLINHHNSLNLAYTEGINQFSDMTEEEFSTKFLGGYKAVDMSASQVGASNRNVVVGRELPESINWCERGACSPPKDQGQCGSCWAFAATEVIESHAQIASGFFYIS